MGIVKKIYKKQKKNLKKSVTHALVGDENIDKAEKYEREGKIKKAAKTYAKTKLVDKAAELYERLGDQETKKQEKKLGYYRTAIEYYEDIERVQRVATKMSTIEGVSTAELSNVAYQLKSIGASDAAGPLFERAGDLDNALACYEEAGDLANYERLLHVKETAAFDARLAAETGMSTHSVSSDEDKKKKKKKKDKKKKYDDDDSDDDFETRVAKLQLLYDSGLITEGEFNAKRRELLSSI